MPKKLLKFLDRETNHLLQAGLLRSEPIVRSAPEEKISLRNRKLVNLASNNYLGFTTHPALKKGAKEAIEEFGLGAGAARALAGTNTLHNQLEEKICEFLHTDDAIVFPSRYHANTGLFESLVNERDFIFCDALCHPSLADGVRLCRARALLYRNNDLNHLEDRLKRSRAARFRVIVTDGVFSTDGTLARLEGIADLAAQYDALLVLDDAHGIGVLGPGGRGTHEHLGVMSRIDLVTGSFANALGAGAGAYIAGREQLITWIRQKSRPYLISNALNCATTGAALQALELLQTDLRPLNQLRSNTRAFRRGLTDFGLDVIKSEHPMVAVRVGEVVTAQKMVDQLNRRGIYTVGFCYPVVPEGEARIRAQISSLHSEQTIKRTAAAFESSAQELKLI